MKGAPYNLDNTPIYNVDMDGNVLGMAQKNGTILVNKDVSPSELEKNKTIEHERVHIDQMKRGDLDYTDTHVLWQGKKYARSNMNEGDKNLPWEKEAYAKQDKQTPLTQKTNKNLYNLKTAFGPKTEKDTEKQQSRRDTEAFLEKYNYNRFSRNKPFNAYRLDKAWEGIDKIK